VERIAFIGAGNMATSLIGGLLAGGRDAATLIVSDPLPDQRDRAAALGIATSDDNAQAVRDATTIVLAVKPQVLGDVVRSLAPSLEDGQLLLSIAAGISTAGIAAWAGRSAAVVRCMPNTPAMVGLGMSALFANDAVTSSQREDASAIMAAVGEVLWVASETDLDAVTAVSGSGPAYFFYLMEGMITAGTELGLDAETARTLTLQTARGAAEMAWRSDDQPAQLRRNVTSPGGTTEAALAVFDSNDLAATIRSALAAAARRSHELGQ
jgi:pyrroline-5-carboxylate reductase